MENNFNMQQNNYQQPMYQQPMMQPVYMKPRRRTGWIAGLIVAAVMVLMFIGAFIWYKVTDKGVLEGTWAGCDIEITFTEIHRDHDLVVYEYCYLNEDGEIHETTCKVNDDKIEFPKEYYDEEEEIFYYDFLMLEIVKITSEKLVLEFKGKEYTLIRK